MMGVLTLTRAHRIANEKINPEAELCDGNCIKDASNPFILLRRRVSSVGEGLSGMSKPMVDAETEPLSQKNLCKRGDKAEVHRLKESSLSASATTGRTT